MRRRKNSENSENGAVYTEASCRAAANLLIYGLLNYYSDWLVDESDNKRAYKRLVKKLDTVIGSFYELNGTDDPDAFSAFRLRMDRTLGRRDCLREEADEDDTPAEREVIKRMGELLDLLLGDGADDGLDDDFDLDFDIADFFGDDEIPS